MRYKKVLALSPHTDDVELGAGATLARLAEEGADIHFVAFSAPRDVLKTEFRLAVRDIMGLQGDASFRVVLDFPRRRFPEFRQDILQWLYDYRAKFEPDLVLVPCSYDLHQDHQTITAEAVRAYKHITIYGYILRWNCRSFHEDVRVPIEGRHLVRKLNALGRYKSQASRHRYFDPEFHNGEAYVRGLDADSHLAEAFEIINLVHSQGMEGKGK